MENPSNHDTTPRRCLWVNGPVIVGAGPSGLSVAAGLKSSGVPFVLLEQSDCIASLWQHHTYGRLRLHLPKQFCQLPGLPFPDSFPKYPSRAQFIAYLESYSRRFGITPRFKERVESARYDAACGLWRVRTASVDGDRVEYVCQWVVAATGENAERVMPDVDGLGEFDGEVIHACDYKSGEKFAGKRVLVVGCGNSGMEVCLDLCGHGAMPFMVVRSPIHVLPREIFGKSTFELAMFMLKWVPLWLVDKVLLFLAWIILGNIGKYGLKRPNTGPMELKNTQGKTPVLDIGTLAKIKSKEIHIVPARIKRFSLNIVELDNGEKLEIDAVIFATGYQSNVPYRLQESEFFCKNGFPQLFASQKAKNSYS